VDIQLDKDVKFHIHGNPGYYVPFIRTPRDLARIRQSRQLYME